MSINIDELEFDSKQRGNLNKQYATINRCHPENLEALENLLPDFFIPQKLEHPVAAAAKRFGKEYSSEVEVLDSRKIFPLMFFISK